MRPHPSKALLPIPLSENFWCPVDHSQETLKKHAKM